MRKPLPPHRIEQVSYGIAMILSVALAVACFISQSSLLFLIALVLIFISGAGFFWRVVE